MRVGRGIRERRHSGPLAGGRKKYFAHAQTSERLKTWASAGSTRFSGKIAISGNEKQENETTTQQAKRHSFIAAGFIKSENKNRLRERFDDFPEYRTQFMEAYEALLAISDDSKPEHEAVLVKMNVDFLRIFEIADSIKLAFDDLGCGKKSEHAVGHSSNSASSADAGGLISHLPTLSLTQISRLDQDWLLSINMFDSLVNSRTDLTAGQKFAYLLFCLSSEPKGLVQHLNIGDDSYPIAGIYYSVEATFTNTDSLTYVNRHALTHNHTKTYSSRIQKAASVNTVTTPPIKLSRRAITSYAEMIYKRFVNSGDKAKVMARGGTFDKDDRRRNARFYM
ncbi:hypothetical protein EVAR_19811_1 [Eumeta japonica]|uniref:Uncharacterized protein n=1 Tax=Eumeta variegata TaxID=151549 RepID=A0A4C1UR22_EUMVA|nr:hypothetical protein EVAR_19811_1 [Eumeta japonica]